MRKYEFTNETMQVGTATLHRIRAVRDFGDVKAGDLGGWIEKEDNLPHDGLCWVSDNAVVMDNASVSENAWVGGNAWIHGNACLCRNAKADGYAWVGQSAEIGGYAWISDTAWVEGNARILEAAKIGGDAWINGKAWIEGDAQIKGNAWISGNAQIGKGAQVFTINDFIVIGAIGSRNEYATFYRNRDNSISVKHCFFCNTVDAFLHAVGAEYGNNKYAKEYQLAAELAKIHILEEVEQE